MNIGMRHLSVAEQEAITKLAEDAAHRALLEHLATGWGRRDTCTVTSGPIALYLLVERISDGAAWLDRIEEEAHRRLDEELRKRPADWITYGRSLRWLITYQSDERTPPDATRIDTAQLVDRQAVLSVAQRAGYHHPMACAYAIAQATVIPS